MSAPLIDPAKNSLRIAILAYDGCMGTQVFGIADVLRIGSDIARGFGETRPQPFDVHVIALTRRQVTLAGGIVIGAKRPAGRFDLLIVPGLEISQQVDWDEKLGPLSRELAYIRKSFAAGTPVASACIGAFLLGEAGLLSGRKVTTAWLFADDLARRYPAAQVQPAAVFLEDAGVTTTGAVSAAFDLAIHLVKRTLGAPAALATARVTMLPSQRESQSPFADPQLMARNLPAFSQYLSAWFNDRLQQPYDLPRVALAFHVSASTLLRRVKAETGQSPLTLLQRARVEKARQLLRQTSWSIARITEAVGYVDINSFSRLFVRWVGETPARYRRR
ncbi:MAG: helix-turn-helix domain-containing protein [Pseudomonadota bacterium]